MVSQSPVAGGEVRLEEKALVDGSVAWYQEQGIVIKAIAIVACTDVFKTMIDLMFSALGVGTDLDIDSVNFHGLLFRQRHTAHSREPAMACGSLEEFDSITRHMVI